MDPGELLEPMCLVCSQFIPQHLSTYLIPTHRQSLIPTGHMVRAQTVLTGQLISRQKCTVSLLYSHHVGKTLKIFSFDLFKLKSLLKSFFSQMSHVP